MNTHSTAVWQKASYSGNGGNCVEVRFDADAVLIRDSKYLRDPGNDPSAQPIITINTADWPDFLANVLGRNSTSRNGIPTIEHHSSGAATICTADGLTLTYTAAEWDAFTSGIRAGEFSPAA